MRRIGRAAADIGQRPILAFGNSDGDLQVLQFTDWQAVFGNP